MLIYRSWEAKPADVGRRILLVRKRGQTGMPAVPVSPFPVGRRGFGIASLLTGCITKQNAGTEDAFAHRCYRTPIPPGPGGSAAPAPTRRAGPRHGETPGPGRSRPGNLPGRRGT